MAERPNLDKLNAQVANLAKRGVALPLNPNRARLAAASLHREALTEGALRDTLGGRVFKGVSENNDTLKTIDENTRMIRSMGQARRAKTASSIGGGDVYAAIPRFYDPMEYWELQGLPWNMADEGHRHKLHKWMRLFYATHYLVPILIDIFTRFPLIGIHVEHPDKQLQKYYEELFLNELDYSNFLVQMGVERWLIGESFALGSFDEDLGIWEREELLNPEDIVIENFPLLGTRQMKLHPPDYLKKLAQTKSPAKQYKQLEDNFPEIIPYLLKNKDIPVSDVLLKQNANLLTPWDDHGTPHILRGLRTLIHEEKLLASQDAIAERLYSPLILAKLGLTDLGDGQGPWVPTPDELDTVRDDLDIAFASDFRLMVYHFGLEIENVFGREQMPRLGDDFDRIERRLMQLFGINPSLLAAGATSQPYASSALQAEFLNQILKTYQKTLQDHYLERAYVVAEAQEHYDYEIKGSTRVPIMEYVREVDEDGNSRIVEKHKLTVPELKFQTLDLRDEATERQFLQTLRAMGVPIPDNKLMVGIEYDINDMARDYNDELVRKTIAQQEAKLKTYKALQAAGLPIPPDLKAEVEGMPPGMGPQAGGGMGGGGGGGPDKMGPAGGGMPGGPHMAPGGDHLIMPPPPGASGIPGLGPGGMGGGVPGGGPPPAGAGPQGGMAGGANAPAVSMERRPGLIVPSSVQGSAPPKPPNYRKGDKEQHCGNCKMFYEGKCWGYGNTPVEAEGVCDSWASAKESSRLHPELEKAMANPRVIPDPGSCPHARMGRAAAANLCLDCNSTVLGNGYIIPPKEAPGDYDPFARFDRQASTDVDTEKISSEPLDKENRADNNTQSDRPKKKYTFIDDDE